MRLTVQYVDDEFPRGASGVGVYVYATLGDEVAPLKCGGSGP